MYISEIAKAQINLLETLSKIANQVAFRELTQKKNQHNVSDLVYRKSNKEVEKKKK